MFKVFPPPFRRPSPIQEGRRGGIVENKGKEEMITEMIWI
jgi:hypothetical protein